MNRRAFLQRVCGGAVAALVVTKLPTHWLPETVKTYAACEFLRAEYNRYMHGRMASGAKFHDAMPQRMTAGRELFEAYESELQANMRFMPYEADGDYQSKPTLMFKGVRLDQEGRGWRVECHG